MATHAKMIDLCYNILDGERLRFFVRSEAYI